MTTKPSWHRALLIVALLVAVLAGLSPPLSASAARTAGGSSAQCAFNYTLASCQSTDPTVTYTFNGMYCDTWQATVSWGDGAESSTGDYTTTATVSHSYTSPGQYTITTSGSGTPPCQFKPSSHQFTLLGRGASCEKAIAAYEADQKSLDKLLTQLADAQNRQADAKDHVSILSDEVDADNALIEQVHALQSASEDDASVVGQTISNVSGALQAVIKKEPFSQAEDKLIDRVKVDIKNALDGLDHIDKDLAATFWERAAALESPEAVQAGRMIDIIDTELIPAVGDDALLLSLSVDLGKILTADAKLALDLSQLRVQDSPYRQAKDRIDALTEALNNAQANLTSENADVKALTGQVDADQSAVQEALIAMTNACAPTPPSHDKHATGRRGANPGSPVTTDYQAPFPFTGALRTVTVDLSGDLITDTEAEMRMAMTRQ